MMMTNKIKYCIKYTISYYKGKEQQANEQKKTGSQIIWWKNSQRISNNDIWYHHSGSIWFYIKWIIIIEQNSFLLHNNYVTIRCDSNMKWEKKTIES